MDTSELLTELEKRGIHISRSDVLLDTELKSGRRELYVDGAVIITPTFILKPLNNTEEKEQP